MSPDRGIARLAQWLCHSDARQVSDLPAPALHSGSPTPVLFCILTPAFAFPIFSRCFITTASKCRAGNPLISRHRMLLKEIPDDDACVKVTAKVAPAAQRLIAAGPVLAAILDSV